MSVYDNFMSTVGEKSKPQGQTNASNYSKGNRPLKMPKGYDFSVRNVNWDQYKNDFLLRTDAVWEKSKLLDTFYTHYKVSHDSSNNKDNAL